MKMTRFLALLLSLVLLCGALASCTGDGGDAPGFSGNRGEDGNWEDVDFGGAALKVKVSAAQDDEGTFPACDIYTKGPDGTTTDETAAIRLSPPMTTSATKTLTSSPETTTDHE